MVTLVSMRKAGPVEMGLVLGNGLPRWDPRPGSSFCAMGWAEGAHLQRGPLGLDICPQGQQGDVCYEGLPLLLTPSHFFRFFPMGLAVTCGSVKFIQHFWSVYSENSGMILHTFPPRVQFPVGQIPGKDSLGSNPHLRTPYLWDTGQVP